MRSRIPRWLARVAPYLIVVALGVAVGLLFVQQADNASSADVAELRSENADLREDVTVSDSARLALEAQVRALGETPVAAPPVSSSPRIQYVPVPGPVGPVGPAGPQGLAGEEGAAGGVGPSGAAGKNGESVTGPTGKDGQDGADGAPGPQGEPGRGVVDSQCGDDGRWTVTYTDGTATDAGICRAPSLLEPVPAE